MPDEESSFQAVTVAGPGTNAWRWDGQNFKAGPILILMYPGLLVEDLVVSSKAMINNYGYIYDASSEKILRHLLGNNGSLHMYVPCVWYQGPQPCQLWLLRMDADRIDVDIKTAR